ncbi:tripartite tricarboxylate transporter substrate binding protein [Roseibium sp.]|uniref:tripartite tricarboxylate transporter substrate binding protein n=1 Tax=Roseibium sp. TaxID=1936156 RepID=UPI003B515BB2
MTPNQHISFYKIARSGTVAALAFAATTFLQPSSALATDGETCISKPVTYVVGYKPGGESDVTARMQQEYFEAITGQPLVIHNRPGAGGATAWAQLNRFDGDGHTLMGTIVPHTVLQPAMKDVGYQTDDINNVYFFHYTPDAILVKADSPFETLNDLIEEAKADPGRITMGGSGTNSANHLATQIIKDLTGAATTYIPFRGSAPAITALLGGQIKAAMSYTTQGVKAGDQVRILAVATNERHPALPDVPTFKELGVDHVGGAFRGVAVPAGTPDGIRECLSGIIAQINANPDFQKRMNDAGYSVIDIPVGDVPAFVEQKKKEYQPAIAQLKSQ